MLAVESCYDELVFVGAVSDNRNIFDAIVGKVDGFDIASFNIVTME